ncbi:MAG: PDZ domain-containing protein [Krumholzibacteria bacterium]|nr:PDZ domain-containing protein [Candidatus Krumholzibacteria bacterium]
MNAVTAARRTLPALALGALLAAAPALAGDSGYLGVRLQDLTPAMVKALQLGDQAGVLVSEVVDESPAAKAGLQDGDVIVAFAGKPLSDYSSLTAAVRAGKPGDKVDVTVLREGRKQTIQVELGEAEDGFAWRSVTGDDGGARLFERLHGDDGAFKLILAGRDRGWLGVHIDDLSPQLGEYFGAKDGTGALVTEVEADSPAAKAGLKAGDVIVKLGDAEITDTADLHEALAGTKPEEQVKVEFLRKGKKQGADVTLAEAPEGDLPGMHFFGDDGDEYHLMAPKMIYRHLPPMGKHDVRVVKDPHRRIEVIREFDRADGDLRQMRKELDEMRRELDRLREELNAR